MAAAEPDERNDQQDSAHGRGGKTGDRLLQAVEDGAREDEGGQAEHRPRQPAHRFLHQGGGRRRVGQRGADPRAQQQATAKNPNRDKAPCWQQGPSKQANERDCKPQTYNCPPAYLVP